MTLASVARDSLVQWIPIHFFLDGVEKYASLSG